MNCVNCGYYGLFKMITSGKPFGYSGDIPCLRCCRYGKNDEHTQSKAEVDNATYQLNQLKK